MENILQWGLDIIRQVQSWASPPLTACMLGITRLGSTVAYLVLLPLVWWCIDKNKGFKLGLAVLISGWLNVTFKFLLDQPRPFFPDFDPLVGMIPERFGGFPSGHAQNALVMWIIIASWVKRKWAFAAAALVVLLVSFSRIYLGVHFPTDIAGGWILGGVVLCVYFALANKIGALLESGGFRARMISVASLSFIMILYRPADDMLMLAGLLLGMGAGYLLDGRYAGFVNSPPPGGEGIVRYVKLAARFVLGIAVTAFLYAAAQKIIPDVHGSSSSLLVIFCLYGIVGLWVAFGAPWLFCRLRLAREHREAQ